MIGSTLQKTAALSLALHVAFIVLVLAAARKTSNFVMPSPYVVRLVSPEAGARARAKAPAPRVEPLAEKAAPAKAPPPEAKKGVTVESPATARPADKAKKPAEDVQSYKEKRLSAIREKVETEKYLSDTLSAIKAKQKLKQVAELRQRAVSIRPSAPQAGAGGGPPVEASILNDYYMRVQDRIWQNWVFPDTGSDDMLAVVSITVMRDGRVKVNGFEKSSGNPLFDRSALRAIEKASPLEPPPFEMEIGVRFTPYAE
jgi:colicin import membrane protein